MKLLVVGNGGREHALAWSLAKDPAVETVYVAPGNGGTALEPKCSNVDMAATDISGLIGFARAENIDFTVIGPEAPLADGIVDAFEAQSLSCFGPSKAASQLESSKNFSKDFMRKHHIPTAKYGTFTDSQAAKNYVATQSFPIVIKADGLAAGKGVVIAPDLSIAKQTIEHMLEGNAFGQAGHKIVIEEFLTGEELSFIAMVDGEHILPLATSQDHKARDDGDTGPNTGGMGAYSPAPLASDALIDKVMNTVMLPTVKGMQAEGTPFKGFLYAGLMISETGDIQVLEFNCRFGDPETQPILMRLQTPLTTLVRAALAGKLDEIEASWDSRFAVGVVVAAKGYPFEYAKGEEIALPACQSHQKVFHAGTKSEQNNTVTSGGRVLCACGLSESLEDAKQAAYQLISIQPFESAFYRKDIADKGIQALQHS